VLAYSITIQYYAISVNNLVIIEELYHFRRVCFYTVRFDGEELSETEKFIARILDTPELEREYGTEMDTLIAILEFLGDVRGAQQKYFRQENRAEALPPPRGAVEALYLDIDNRLRLYCVRLSDEVVVLFGGGIKTASAVQDSPDVRMHFQLAQRIARALDEVLHDGHWKVVGTEIFSDGQERLLYL
jgi:hypothetical protein